MWFATLLCIINPIAINSFDHWIIKYFIVMAESVPCSDASLATFPLEIPYSSPPTSSSSTSSCQLSSQMKSMQMEWSEDVQRYVMGGFCFCVWHCCTYWVIVVHVFGGKIALTPCRSLFRNKLTICSVPVNSSDYFRNHTIKTFLCSMREGNLPFQFLLDLYFE